MLSGWQGRVNSQSVLKVANTDLVPGKYEGVSSIK